MSDIDSIATVSGGMDSVTMLHYLVKVEKKNPAVLSFSYGQKHKKEIEFARTHAEMLGCPQFKIVDLTTFSTLFASSSLVSNEIMIPRMDDVVGDPQPSTYVPNRNMLFLSLAAAWAETCGVTDIYYGAQRHDFYGYWDTTELFLQNINQLLGLNRKQPTTIHAPFIQQSKTDILQTGLALGIDYAQTWSCYEGKIAACGSCPTCGERLKAFDDVGVVDPVRYANASIG